MAPQAGQADRETTTRASRQRRVRRDPIGELAAAAGFDDAERWWEDAVEHRRHSADVFADVLDAMRELRTDDLGNEADADDFGPQREASMRLQLRAAVDRHERVVDDSERREAQEIHLEQRQLLQAAHIELRHNFVPVGFVQRDQFCERL